MRLDATIWVVSGLVSLAVHAGLMRSLSAFSLEPLGDDTLAEVILASGALAVPATTGSAVAEAMSAAPQDALSATEPQDSGVVVPSPAVEAAKPASELGSGSATPSAEAEPAGVAAASPSEAVVGTVPETETTVAAASPTVAELSASPGSLVATEGQGSVAPSKPASAAAASSAAPDASASLAASPALTANSSGTAGVVPPVEGLPAEVPSSAAATAVPAASGGAGEAKASPVPPAPAAETPGDSSQLAAGTQVASIPANVPSEISPAEKIDRFLSSYKSGGCLYAKPQSLDAERPTFGGFGGETPVRDFASAFRQAVGVEPQMAVRTIQQPQCAAVDFLQTFNGADMAQLDLVLDSEVAANGQFIAGHINGHPQGEVRLLVVGDDGAVSDISKDFYRTGGKNLFLSPVVADAEGRSRTQIIVALASQSPLAIAAAHQPGEADALFRDIARQVRDQGSSVSIGYNSFKVE